MKNEENKAQLIGSKIKAAREEVGMSQLDLAKQLDFESSTAISLIEKGERNITVENLEKISNILHKDIKFFINKEEKANTVTVETALRADKDLSKEAKDILLQFIESARNRKK